MPLLHAIVHPLNTQDEKPPELREQELAVDEDSYELLYNLKSQFLSRMGREHGRFSAEGEATALLQQSLESLQEDGGRFIELSQGMVHKLDEALRASGQELAAHLFFFEDKNENNHLFYLFGAAGKQELAIDENLQITRRESIDTGSSLFGIKVDIQEWQQEQNYAYLSLLPARGERKLNELLKELSGFDPASDKVEETAHFISGVEDFSDAMEDEQANAFRQQVVDYCLEQERNDEPVNLSELARSMEGIDDDEFVRTVASRYPKGNTDVRLDRKSLRRYVKFSGREKDLAVSFSSAQLNERVVYDEERDELSIRGVPKGLKDQLRGHLNKS